LRLRRERAGQCGPPRACRTRRGLRAIVPSVRSVRRCSRTGCTNPAVATLTFVYSDSTAVVGPLATYSEPHSYDLCERHALRLTAPRGWDVVRHDGEFAEPEPSVDDLTALAEAVREAGRVDRPMDPVLAGPANGSGRRGHLRVLPDPVDG
jgi:uncharacterized protein DUF3499